MREDPERFDCTTCALASWEDSLWPENGEAWRIYQTLCGRTVGILELGGPLVMRATADWPIEQLLDLLARLDVILDVLQPEGAPTPHGAHPPPRDRSR